MAHKYSTISADGVSVFSGTQVPSGPVILLLHGFPSSSHQFRNFIPLLASAGYRAIAPDYPGFGFTTVPPERNCFRRCVKHKKFTLFIFDYGAPIGFSIALERPDAITAIISQNGNCYEEELGDTWGPMKKYWVTDSAEDREIIRSRVLNPERTYWQYTSGSPTDGKGVPPETYTLDLALMDRVGNKETQLDLFRDYMTNVEMYPRFQEYLRLKKPKILAFWGRFDKSFVPAGAEAFKKDVADAEVRFVDAGHFALEERGEEVAEHMLSFLARAWGR